MIVKFYSTLKDKIDKKALEYNVESLTIRKLLDEIDINYPIKEYLLDGDKIILGTMILVNGKNIIHLNGLDTIVNKTDIVDFFPPSAGG